MMYQFNKLDKIFIFLTILFGSLILFFPVQYLLLFLLCLIITVYLLANPIYCYYSVVFSIPLISPNVHYIHFQDVLIYICLIGVYFSRKNNLEFSLVTVINKWVIAILILFIFKGLTALDFSRGILYSIRFVEAIILFYLTIYFIRTKKIKILMIMKILIFTSLIQASLGIVQSLTNKFGVQGYCTDRGYFGYMGLGSKTVCSGRGTFWHFAPFGHYLSTILLLFMPIYHYCIKNKKVGNIIITVLFMGITFSYSRGAMSGVIIGYLYYLFLIAKDKIAFFKKMLFFILILAPFAIYLSTNQDYIKTLSPRDYIWALHFSYLQDNPMDFWFGTGFESRLYGFFRYLPGNIPIEKYLNFNAHNLYLNFIEELGIFGAFVYFSFLITIFIDTFKRINIGSKLQRTMNLSLHLSFFMIFYGGVNDHVYHNPYMLIFLMLIIGIVYAKNKKIPAKNL